MKPWHPYSWLDFPVLQQPCFEDQGALRGVLAELAHPTYAFIPPSEILGFRQALAQAAKGEVFLLQGGDCAERFQDATPHTIALKALLLDRLASLCSETLKRPVIPLGRIAGQYGKPRSQEYEVKGHEYLPVFRGENIHSAIPDQASRIPDPKRLLMGAKLAKYTYTHLKAWSLCQGRPPIYVSHEGLILMLEAALTHAYKGDFFNQSAHFLWMGERTRGLGQGHSEYMRGIENPMGIKLGRHISPEELLQLVHHINPHNKEGRVALITRVGALHVEHILPCWIRAVQRAGLEVTWICDPMHGNTVHLPHGVKTRYLEHIVGEMQDTVAIHERLGSCLGGVHLELSHEPIDECLNMPSQPNDIPGQYTSYCDPRLNTQQSIEFIAQAPWYQVSYQSTPQSTPQNVYHNNTSTHPTGLHLGGP